MEPKYDTQFYESILRSFGTFFRKQLGTNVCDNTVAETESTLLSK